MKTKFLAILFISISLFFIACDEDSITEAVLGSNSVTLSGDISDSFDVQSIAGLYVDDSVSIFTLMMSPNVNTEVYEDIVLIAMESPTIPPVGTYIISTDEENPNSLHASYTRNDSTFYLMTSGTVEVTKSSATKIEGTFDMKGPRFSFNPSESGELTVKGKFSTVPMDL